MMSGTNRKMHHTTSSVGLLLLLFATSLPVPCLPLKVTVAALRSFTIAVFPFILWSHGAERARRTAGTQFQVIQHAVHT